MDPKERWKAETQPRRWHQEACLDVYQVWLQRAKCMITGIEQGQGHLRPVWPIYEHLACSIHRSRSLERVRQGATDSTTFVTNLG